MIERDTARGESLWPSQLNIETYCLNRISRPCNSIIVFSSLLHQVLTDYESVLTGQ